MPPHRRLILARDCLHDIVDRLQRLFQFGHVLAAGLGALRTAAATAAGDGRHLLDNLARVGTLLHRLGAADRAEVEEYAKSLGIYGQCRFTGAIRDREALRGIYSRSDLFLFPSTFDTNGLVVREAAACGLGSLLIRGSCAAEGVEDGKTGILVEENAQSILEALKAYIPNREAMHTIGRQAQDKLYFSWDESVSHAYKRYWEVLDIARIGETCRAISRTDDLYTFQSEWADTMGKIVSVFKKR